jgi:exosome complex component RRP40
MASADHRATSVGAAAGAGAAAPAHRPFVERFVLPGDDVTDDLALPGDGAGAAVRLGNGLAQDGDGGVAATKAGVLSHRAPNRFFALNSQRRYVPAVGDTVVGVVVDRNAEFYRVRLHGTGVAQLPVLAFDGATKRNKPSLAVGATVFARVVACSRHLDPELACTAGGAGPKKDWMTGQSVYGELKGGTLVRVSTGLARRLVDPSAAVLTALGGGLPFEVAVGVNGLVWVQAASGACACGWAGGWLGGETACSVRVAGCPLHVLLLLLLALSTPPHTFTRHHLSPPCRTTPAPRPHRHRSQARRRHHRRAGQERVPHRRAGGAAGGARPRQHRWRRRRRGRRQLVNGGEPTSAS